MTFEITEDFKKYLKMFNREIFNRRDEVENLKREELMYLGSRRFTAVQYDLYKMFKANAMLESYPGIYEAFGFKEFETNLGEKS